MVINWCTIRFYICMVLAYVFIVICGCRHLDKIESEEVAVTVEPSRVVKTNVKTNETDVIVYRGHEYVVYTVQGSYLGLTHSSDCHCKKERREIKHDDKRRF